MSLDLIPPELIIKCSLILDLDDLARLIRTNKYLNEIVDSSYFWKERFIQDYGCVKVSDDMKGLYQRYGTVYISESSLSPKKIPKFKAQEVAFGDRYIVFIDFNDDFWIKDSSGLNKISNIKVKRIASGHYHTLFISLDDKIYILKNNTPDVEILRGTIIDQMGLLPNTETTNYFFDRIGFKAKQIATQGHIVAFINLDDLLCITGMFGVRPFSVLFDHKVKRVSIGSDHVVFTDLDDNVWSFGHNTRGELGLGHTEPTNEILQIPQLKGKEVFAGDNITFLIDLDDNIWIWGDNQSTPIKLYHSKAKTLSVNSQGIIFTDLEDNIWKISLEISMHSQIFGVKAMSIAINNSQIAFIET